jgi:MFS family permease
MASTSRSSIRSWFPVRATAGSKRLLATRALRGLADGAVSVLLPSYLSALGLGATQIGIIVFGTLLGSALVTLWAGFVAHRVGERRLLMGASVCLISQNRTAQILLRLLGGGDRTAAARASAVQFLQQRLGVLQVGGVEAFGEPAVDLGEHRARLVAMALLREQPREASRRAQFQ